MTSFNDLKWIFFLLILPDRLLSIFESVPPPSSNNMALLSHDLHLSTISPPSNCLNKQTVLPFPPISTRIHHITITFHEGLIKFSKNSCNFGYSRSNSIRCHFWRITKVNLAPGTHHSAKALVGQWVGQWVGLCSRKSFPWDWHIKVDMVAMQ